MIKIRDALRFTVSFFLMFAVIVMQLSFFVNLRMLNGNFYRITLSKSDYFPLMRKDIDFGFKNLAMITSIPEEIFVNSVSKDAVKQLANKNIVSAEAYMKYENKYIDYKIDTNIIYNNLEKYAVENDLKVDEGLKKQLSATANDAGNIVRNYAALFNISAVDKYPQFQQFRKIVYLFYSIKILSVVAVALLMALLVVLNRRRPRRALLWVGSSLLPAALITLIPAALALIYKISYKFAIDTPYLKTALRVISLGYINYFMETGALILILGVASTWAYTYLSNKAYKLNQG